VRELRHAIERAVLVCDGDVIQAKDLPPALAKRGSGTGFDPGKERLIDALERMERTMIVSALEKSGWVKARAARTLGLNERVLTYKMNNLGIEKAAQLEVLRIFNLSENSQFSGPMCIINALDREEKTAWA
jgi:DNA-binding NtrC family response regulator